MMMTRESGAVPSQLIRQFIQTGVIESESPVPEGNIQPASMDLRVGEKGFCVSAAFLPTPNETIEQALDHFSTEEFSLQESYTLKKGKTYCLEVMESFSLPPKVRAYTNNKSTTGRMNIWVRTLSDYCPRFDMIEPGYQGKMYVMVTPRCWDVTLQKGCTLNQIRFFVGGNALNDLELSLLHEELGLVFDAQGRKMTPNLDRGLLLTADLRQEIVGYRALECDQPIDLTKGQVHQASDYFEPLVAKNGELFLHQGEFYILSTLEYIRVAKHLAVEMVAYDIHSGEYRSHFAGFFDPGFGYGAKGEIKGTPAVLEVDPHEDVIFRHGQPICKMVFESLMKEPDCFYGSKIGSHYQNQRGPQLGRYFLS